MNAERAPKTLIIASLLLAFGLGVVFGVLAARNPRRYRPGPRVALAPALDDSRIADNPPLAPQPLRSPVDGDSVPGDGTAVAPSGYPIKGNGRSGIYHVPGGFAYDRTVPSICFRTEDAARATGFRASKS